jgi:hypothetical protein
MATGGTIFTNKNIIWIAIILVIAILGYMSFQMMKEAGKQKHNICRSQAFIHF